MAQQLKSINLVAPGFKGINTEDSPLAQDPSFAEIADNAVIDKRGRVAARKGLSVTTTNKTALGTAKIQAIKEFKGDGETTTIFSVGNNKILSGTTTLTDETPGSYTISADNWKMVNFNNKIYFFQRGQEPLVYPDSSNVVKLSTVTGAAGVSSAMYGNEVLSAYGRLWTADFTNDKSTVYWSDLLIGHDWSGGTSGSIDISKVWPDGYDEIVALAAHNSLLIIFGKHSIVVYKGAESPATMSLTDTVAGVGCVDRDTVQHTGTDVLFLSHTGLRSFGRTIQEKSMPITNLSATITKDIIGLLSEPNETFTSVYHPEESFYLLTFRNQDITLCFDIRGTIENGAYRVTRWPGTAFTAYERKDDGVLLIGGSHGIGTYSGNQDNGNSYRFKYFSPELTFGDPAKLKFLKKLRPTIVGGSGASLFLNWAYDFNTTYTSQFINLSTQGAAEFGVSEYPSFSELSSLGISSTLTNGVYVVNKYLGEFNYFGLFPYKPTVGSGGGSLLNGDSWFERQLQFIAGPPVPHRLWVEIGGVKTNVATLTPATSSEFSSGELTSRNSINANGSGGTLTIGLESDINGFKLSLQEINVLALVGKTI